MRLLFFTRIFRLAGSGAEDYAVRLCSALSERGHEVHVVADDIDDMSGLHCHADTSRIPELISTLQPDLTIDWQFVHEADIHRMGSGVHASFIRYSLEAYSGLPRLYKQWRYRGKKHREIMARQRRLLTRPDAWFLPNSNFCADQARDNGADPEHVITLHNGVDTKRFHPCQDDMERSALRRQWGLDEGDIAFLFVAHNLRLKNYPLLARLFRRLDRHLKLVVVGKHRPVRMPDNVIHAGKIDDMAAACRAADALLHPTYYDSCANVVLEAMSSGLPVVVSDRCGANELLADGESGFELPVVGDKGIIADMWRRRIESLGGDEALRLRVGARARAAMLKNDFEDYVDRLAVLLAARSGAESRR